MSSRANTGGTLRSVSDQHSTNTPIADSFRQSLAAARQQRALVQQLPDIAAVLGVENVPPPDPVPSTTLPALAPVPLQITGTQLKLQLPRQRPLSMRPQPLLPRPKPTLAPRLPSVSQDQIYTQQMAHAVDTRLQHAAKQLHLSEKQVKDVLKAVIEHPASKRLFKKTNDTALGHHDKLSSSAPNVNVIPASSPLMGASDNLGMWLDTAYSQSSPVRSSSASSKRSISIVRPMYEIQSLAPTNTSPIKERKGPLKSFTIAPPTPSDKRKRETLFQEEDPFLCSVFSQSPTRPVIRRLSPSAVMRRRSPRLLEKEQRLLRSASAVKKSGTSPSLQNSASDPNLKSTTRRTLFSDKEAPSTALLQDPFQQHQVMDELMRQWETTQKMPSQAEADWSLLFFDQTESAEPAFEPLQQQTSASTAAPVIATAAEADPMNWLVDGNNGITSAETLLSSLLQQENNTTTTTVSSTNASPSGTATTLSLSRRHRPRRLPSILKDPISVAVAPSQTTTQDEDALYQAFLAGLCAADDGEDEEEFHDQSSVVMSDDEEYRNDTAVRVSNTELLHLLVEDEETPLSPERLPPLLEASALIASAVQQQITENDAIYPFTWKQLKILKNQLQQHLQLLVQMFSIGMYSLDGSIHANESFDQIQNLIQLRQIVRTGRWETCLVDTASSQVGLEQGRDLEEASRQRLRNISAMEAMQWLSTHDWAMLEVPALNQVTRLLDAVQDRGFKRTLVKMTELKALSLPGPFVEATISTATAEDDELEPVFISSSRPFQWSVPLARDQTCPPIVMHWIQPFVMDALLLPKISLQWRNRTIFFECDDALLLTGLRRYPYQWSLIRDRYLPTKSCKQIFIRYKNLTSRRAAMNPIKEFYFEKTLSLTLEEEALLIQKVEEKGQLFQAIAAEVFPNIPWQILKRSYRQIMERKATPILSDAVLPLNEASENHGEISSNEPVQKDHPLPDVALSRKRSNDALEQGSSKRATLDTTTTLTIADSNFPHNKQILGDQVLTWNKEEDRILLTAARRDGATESTWSSLADSGQLQSDKHVDAIAQRYSHLVQLFKMRNKK